MEFIEKSGGLNDLSNYPQLRERCKTIGYDVSKVVFRGYYASPKLQEMHDSAISARTKIKLEVNVSLPISVPAEAGIKPLKGKHQISGEILYLYNVKIVGKGL